MLDIGKEFGSRIDKQLSEGGIWEEILNGATALIARAGNEKYMQEWNKIPRKIRNDLENGDMSEEASEEILCRIVSRTILLDWKGLGDNGKPVKFSVDNAFAMLKKYPSFRNLVWDIAQDQQRYHTKAIEETVKN